MTVERTELAPGYSIARVLNGGWQLSEGHHPGAVDADEAVRAMIRLAEAGFTTFDCADIYTGVEELLGRFLRQWPRRDEIQIHTKMVPDRSTLATLTKGQLERIVDRSLKRLGVERLDLVQFHWWEPEVPGCVEAALWLDELRRSGKIRLVGATNFPTAELQAIVNAGVAVAAHQVQVSLLDHRCDGAMTELCERHGIRLLCYGSLAGGFLSSRYLQAAEPAELINRSLVKYRLIVDEFGRWALLQELLETLHTIAEKHDVEMANVAVRWVLDRPAVAAAIVGARTAAHLESNRRVFALVLDDEDRRHLDGVLARSQGPSGEVFGLERVPRGRHRVIMKTDLNRLATS